MIIPEGIKRGGSQQDEYFGCFPYLLPEPGGGIALANVYARSYDLSYLYRFRRFAILPPWKSLMSVPFEPADPDPTIVFSALQDNDILDGRLIRWSNPGGGSIAFDIYDPDSFGGIHLPRTQPLVLQGGFWATNATYAVPGSPERSVIVGFHGVASNAATYDISIPSAGKAMIGCPYPRPIAWEDVTVTQGTGTPVSMEAARDNGWLSSLTTWWDADAQSTRDMGLPDDWATSEYLLPWHGYWVTTNVPAVTLHIPRPW